MRIFCIHCGAANASDVLTCMACNRALLPTTASLADCPAATRYVTHVPAQPASALGMSHLLRMRQSCNAGAIDGSMFDSCCAYAQDDLAPASFAAGIRLRAIAGIIDLAAGGVALSVIFVLLGIVQLAFSLSDAATGTLALVALAAWWPLYFVGCWATSGRTLGYRVAGLRLVTKIGRQASFSACMVRFIGALCSLSSLLLGYLWMLWDDERQTWHDKMAGTMVVSE